MNEQRAINLAGSHGLLYMGHHLFTTVLYWNLLKNSVINVDEFKMSLKENFKQL